MDLVRHARIMILVIFMVLLLLLLDSKVDIHDFLIILFHFCLFVVHQLHLLLCNSVLLLLLIAQNPAYRPICAVHSRPSHCVVRLKLGTASSILCTIGHLR